MRERQGVVGIEPTVELEAVHPLQSTGIRGVIAIGRLKATAAKAVVAAGQRGTVNLIDAAGL